MVTAVTRGISISVETAFQPDYSQAALQEFIFAYRIYIRNDSVHPVQLLDRHWEIFDASGEEREVNGAGVIGKQPIIHPGQEFDYVSSCNLKAELGTMEGYYTMMRLADKQRFRVRIPRFQMVVPYKLS